MKILDRYLITRFLRALLYCLVVILSLYIIIDLFGHLDEILREHIGLDILLTYYLTSIPAILVQVMPPAVLLAVMYLLAVLNRHNELIAMKAAGVSQWRFCLPLFICGAFISAFALILNETLVPHSSAVASLIKEETIHKNTPQRRLSKLALFGQNNRLFYIDTFDVKAKTLNGLIILEQDDQHIVRSKLTCKKALWRDGVWRAHNGIYYKMNPTGDIVGELIIFDEKLLDIPEVPGDFIKGESRVDLMSYRELRDYIKRLGPGSGKTTHRLYVDLHYKLSLLFMNLFILIVGAAFGLGNYRGKMWLEFGLAILIGLSYYAFISLSLALGKGGLLAPFLSAHLANFVFGGVGLRLLAKAR